MCIQWKTGLPYEDGKLMDYETLATWAHSLEAGLDQLAQLPEGGSARALLVRSNYAHRRASSPAETLRGFVMEPGFTVTPGQGGGHCMLPSDHRGPCAVKQ